MTECCGWNRVFFLQQPGAYKHLIAVKRREAAAGSGHLSAAQRRILKIYWPRSGLDTEKRQRAKRASPETSKNGEFTVYQQIRSAEMTFKHPRSCLKASAVNEKNPMAERHPKINDDAENH